MTRLLYVNFSDAGGGAAKIAQDLFKGALHAGYDAHFAVGVKRTAHPYVIQIDHDIYRGPWPRFWAATSNALFSSKRQLPGANRLRHYLKDVVGQPRRWIRAQRGREDDDFPGTWRLLSLTDTPPQIIHAHNLHNNYFDLRALSWLSQQVPLVLTLHDAWLLSGHCAHSLECQRWKTGCGRCPDLTLYPSIRRDGTASNWRRKQEIFAKSRIYVAAPSKWLMRKIRASMVAPAIVDARVIYNGVDLEIFHPTRAQASRSELHIPLDYRVIFFVGERLKVNSWKGYDLLERAAHLITKRLPDQRILFVALGDTAPPVRIGKNEIVFFPYEKDVRRVALFYQAADLFLNASKADTFPTTVLEALACGVPVISTAVGGIPEQVKDLATYSSDQATGALIEPGDHQGMAEIASLLLKDNTLLNQLSANAVVDAKNRFDVNRMIQSYLSWYQEILVLG